MLILQEEVVVVGGGDLGPSSLIWKRSLCHHLNYPPRHDMINKIPRDSKQDIW